MVNFRIKRFVISFVAIIIIILLFMTWFYPFSNYSIYQSYNYKPDSVMVAGYLEDLNEFKTSLEKDLEHENQEDGYINFTVDRTQYVLSLFEQDWLVSKEPVRISKRDIEDMLFKVENVRETLLDLIAREDYTVEQRDYLVSTIKNILYIEDQLHVLKEGKGTSRSSLRIQLHNLHGEFMGAFMMYSSFYNLIRNPIENE